MIYFASKPTPFFYRVFEQAMEFCIEQLRVCVDCGWPHSPVLDEDVVEMFGGPQGLLNHLRELWNIFHHQKVYQISDYSYLSLDRVLRTYCEIYNDSMRDPGTIYVEGIIAAGALCRYIDVDELLETFFWDQDYDLTPEIFNQLTPEDKACAGFNHELFGVINRLQPHKDELRPIETDFNTEQWAPVESGH